MSIDSNIWLHEDMGSFFSLLASTCNAHGYSFAMPGTQYDEIVNLKRSDRGEKNERAGLAFKRIEWFQKAGLLSIENLGLQSDPTAYADAFFIKMFIANTQKGICSTLITMDRDLRIRVRGNSGIQCRLVEIPDTVIFMYDRVIIRPTTYHHDLKNTIWGWLRVPETLKQYVSILQRTVLCRDETSEKWIQFLTGNPYRELFYIKKYEEEIKKFKDGLY